jgi:N-acetylglucosaminyldiphosphoundecaprenol N-acetyl-beta-D-mannosaminyltransferase
METRDLPVVASDTASSDLDRNVYCVIGLPIDALDMPATLDRIEAAARSRTRCFISTVNLNFLVTSLSDGEFRASVLDSDLCPIDGVPLVWIARLIGIPVAERVSGSDIFDALKARDRKKPLGIFLFGGEEGVAEEAGSALNATRSGLTCVGSLNPGFGTVEQMSNKALIDKVNASQADFLAASLGARKGQLWLHRNLCNLTVPVRAHLGAVMNFQAGTVKRAPTWLRTRGLEWLWRIKEEPHLWRRYVYDGIVLMRLLLTRVLPLATLRRWQKLRSAWRPKDLLISTHEDHDSVIIRLRGHANQRNSAAAIACFRETLTKGTKHLVIDLTGTRVIDGRFFGLLLMVRKSLKGQGAKLDFTGLSPVIRREFWLNGVDFLLSDANTRT